MLLQSCGLIGALDFAEQSWPSGISTDKGEQERVLAGAGLRFLVGSGGHVG